MQIYFEEEFVAIYYDKSNGVIVVESKMPPTSQQFRNGMDVLIEALQYFSAGKVIFDALFLGMLLYSDQEWISSDWYGRAIKAGYLQVALIFPRNVSTNMFVKGAVKRTTDRIPTAYFNNRTAAIDWMNEF